MEELSKEYQNLEILLKGVTQRLDRLESRVKYGSNEQQTPQQEKPQQMKEDMKIPEKSDVIQFALLEKYLRHMLQVLPTPYSTQDSNRMTLIYFVTASLDLIGKLDSKMKQQIISFVYSLQTLPDKDKPDRNVENCGFKGGSFFGKKYDDKCETQTNLNKHEQSHIAMTYTALSVLTICGDDFSRVNKKAILKATKSLQQEDGSFVPVFGGSENDMRFVYCASAICKMLNDWSGMDVEKATNYIVFSQSYDFAIGQGPAQESHGGSTYCAIAALKLMNNLSKLPHKEELIKWCVLRQQSGFQGRINKIPDTCYSFWIGSTLALLGAQNLVNESLLRAHTMNCQKKIGGFAKWPDQYPDVLHTYFSLCGLSLLANEPNIAKIDPALGFNIQHANKFYQ